MLFVALVGRDEMVSHSLQTGSRWRRKFKVSYQTDYTYIILFSPCKIELNSHYKQALGRQEISSSEGLIVLF